MAGKEKQQQDWFVYLVESEAGLYCGITTNLERRFHQHSIGKGAKFFRRAQPIAIIYSETYPDRGLASKREYQIKQLTRAQKLALVVDKSNG